MKGDDCTLAIESQALCIRTLWAFGLAWRLRLERVRRGERDPFFVLVR